MPNVALVSLNYCASKFIELYILIFKVSLIDAIDVFLCNLTIDTIDYTACVPSVFRENSVLNLEKTIDVSQKYSKSSILSIEVKYFFSLFLMLV